ncbi:MAG: hypothetical protein GY910_10825 [bacterium]|nr:oxidoreductase [Deltaproteobacteria bacterium]MCP4905462.1 hypothetical protein [bacterium]
MRRVILITALLGLIGIAACSLLWPRGMVIRGPMLGSMLGRGVGAPTELVVRDRFRTLPGLRVDLFAEGIENARFMRFSPGGDLVVSQPRSGQLRLVLGDRDGDGRSDGHRVLLDGLDRPHGFDFREGHLYIGEGSAIARIAYSEKGPDSLAVEGEVIRIVEGIPQGGNHWSHSLRFGADGGMYIHVGSSCNVCEEEDARRAAILRYEPDGSGEEIYAYGLRNSVGFDWRPGTNEFYATDNGRDLLGDDDPPCELNRIERGAFYGWPYANGDRRPDPDFGEGHEGRIATSTPPVHPFRAHNAPLGMTFIRSADAPEAIRGAALVALHGSWNRSRLDGYKVVSLHWDEAGQIAERDFLTGFEIEEDVIGRPVDVAEGPDGSIYVSDDYAGAIYRVRIGKDARGNVERRLRPPPGATQPAADPLASLDPEERARLVARGETLFEDNACTSCHRTDPVETGSALKPLDALTSRFDIDSLVTFFQTPTPPMPVVHLPRAERRALATYLLERYP